MLGSQNRKNRRNSRIRRCLPEINSGIISEQACLHSPILSRNHKHKWFTIIKAYEHIAAVSEVIQIRYCTYHFQRLLGSTHLARPWTWLRGGLGLRV